MKIVLSKEAEKSYAKLPFSIKKKADKQFNFLATNIKHPSLRVKKMQGLPFYEARIDYHYRFIFSIGATSITIITLGPHDEGLGKN